MKFNFRNFDEKKYSFAAYLWQLCCAVSYFVAGVYRIILSSPDLGCEKLQKENIYP